MLMMPWLLRNRPLTRDAVALLAPISWRNHFGLHLWLTGSVGIEFALAPVTRRLSSQFPSPCAKRSDVERPQPNLLNNVGGAVDSDLLRRGRIRARMDAFQLNELREHALSNGAVTATNQR